MSCTDNTKNIDIKLATYNSLDNLYKYTTLPELTPNTQYDPFTSKGQYTILANINTNLDTIDSDNLDKNNLFIRDPNTSNIYQNCAIQANNPWFTANSDYSKCEIVKNIVLDDKLKLNTDKTTINLNLKSKNKSKPAFCPYFSNVNKAFCENKWYDWIITPNYYLGNTYYKDISKYTELDVYKCYKPCSGDDKRRDYLPYTTEKGEFKCIPKKLFGNGIFANKYMFSPIGLINLIGNIAYSKNIINANNNLLFLLYKSILDYNLENNIDTKIYDKNDEIYNNIYNSQTNILNNNIKNDFTIDINKEFIDCIKENIIHNFSTAEEQDYTYIKEFTYKSRKFNENEPEMYTLNGLDASGVLIPPILHHTWILANIFKPVLEDDIKTINVIDTIDILKTKKEFYCSISLYENLRLIFEDDDIANRLKNIFYKAVNICYNNKTNFSTNIIDKTKKSFSLYNNKYNTLLNNIFYYSDEDIKKLYLTDNKVFFVEHKFYYDYELYDLETKNKNAILLFEENNKFKYFFSVERLEIKTCENGFIYNTQLHECQPEVKPSNKVEEAPVEDDIDNTFNIPELTKILSIFLQIILFIIFLYILYIFYDIFGEIILSIYNYIYMKLAELSIAINKKYGPTIIPGRFESDEHKKYYSAEQDYNLANLQHENLQRNKLKLDEYINTHNIANKTPKTS